MPSTAHSKVAHHVAPVHHTTTSQAPLHFSFDDYQFSTLAETDATLRNLGVGVIPIAQTQEAKSVGGWEWILYKKNIETISFCANISLAFLAIAAGIIAYRQIRESAHSRTANLYMEIMELWDKKETKHSRDLIKGLQNYYKSGMPAMERAKYDSESEYVNQVLLEFRRTDPQRYAEYIAVAGFFEYLGVMLRRSYVNKYDVWEFFAGQTVVYLDALVPFFENYQTNIRHENEKRAISGDAPIYAYPDAIYANAIWLHKATKDYKPYPYHTRWARLRMQFSKKAAQAVTGV